MLGSKGGVGTTTMSASLAGFAGSRFQTVLSCAEPRFEDLAAITGVGANWSIGEGLLHASIPWREGVVLLPAATGSAVGHRLNLLPRVASVEPGCQMLIVDCGSWDASAAAQSLCEQSDAIVIATTSDNLAMMDTYACIKQLSAQYVDVGGKLHIAINQVGDRAAATEASLACS